MEDGVATSFPLVRRWHLPQMLGVVARIPVGDDGQVDLLAGVMSADSTIVRADQHAAGAR